VAEPKPKRRTKHKNCRGDRRSPIGSSISNCKLGTTIRWNHRLGQDAEFHREYKILTGEDPEPLMPEEMEKAIREMPRDAEVIDLLKKVSSEGPLPAR